MGYNRRLDEITANNLRKDAVRKSAKGSIKYESEIFEKHIKEIVSEQFGKITMIENRDGLEDLDYGGMDAWSSIDGVHRTLSLRTSHTTINGKPWDTFTFREYETSERIKSLNPNLGIFMPNYHVESSFVSGELITIRYALMYDIIKIAKNYTTNVMMTNSSGICWKSWYDGEELRKFLVMECERLKSIGIPVRKWSKEKGWDGPPLYKCECMI